ncbi:hypothetical protein [Streptomyces albidocamelliae]
MTASERSSVASDVASVSGVSASAVLTPEARAPGVGSAGRAAAVSSAAARSAISRFRAEAEIRMVAPLTRSPLSPSSSPEAKDETAGAAGASDGTAGGCGEAGAAPGGGVAGPCGVAGAGTEPQAGWKPLPGGRSGIPTGGPTGGGGAAGVAAAGGGVGVPAGGGTGADGDVPDVPDAFCVYQAGGA